MPIKDSELIDAIREMAQDAPKLGVCPLPFRLLEELVAGVIGEKDAAIADLAMLSNCTTCARGCEQGRPCADFGTEGDRCGNYIWKGKTA